MFVEFQPGDKVRPSLLFIKHSRLREAWIIDGESYTIEAVKKAPEKEWTVMAHSQHVTIKEDQGLHRRLKWSGAFWEKISE